MTTALKAIGILIGATLSLGAADKPNIMVFLVDDMGVMDTSLPFLTDSSGKPKRYPLNDFYRTPSMERLAKQGIRFNQFYAMSVCSPTRISIMTGQNAARHGTTNWINPKTDNRGTHGPEEWNWKGLSKGDITLPGLLKGQGYRTIHVGKGHFGPKDSEGANPANLGFDVNIAGAEFGAPGSYFSEKHYGAVGKRKSHAVPHLDAYHGSGTFLSEALTLEAKKAVAESVKTDQPFYLYFSHYGVHSPFESDPRFAENYKDSGKPVRAQAYATLIEGIDHSLGSMLDLFSEMDVDSNTLVVFLGDNGGDAPLGDQHVVACAAPLRGKKGAHYEGGMRVPFIAAWAKQDPENSWQKQLPIPSGAIQGQIANVTDLFPTILNLAGVEVPEDHKVDGEPLATLLSGKKDASRPEQFLMHYPHGKHRSNYFTVWRDGDWKLIFHALPDIPAHGGYKQADSHYQLFNLAEDPFEQKDLSKEKPEILTEMIEGLKKALKDHEALHPVINGKKAEPAAP
ncbi:MAG: sulfatase [Akkermansiaceae bacterium]